MGIDLRLDWAREVLENLVRIWKRPVRLDTFVDGKAVRLGHDGKNATASPTPTSLTKGSDGQWIEKGRPK